MRVGATQPLRRAAGLRVERTVVKPASGDKPATAEGSGEFSTIECQLVLESIGYKSLPLKVGRQAAGAGRRSGAGGRGGRLTGFLATRCGCQPARLL